MELWNHQIMKSWNWEILKFWKVSNLVTCLLMILQKHQMGPKIAERLRLLWLGEIRNSWNNEFVKFKKLCYFKVSMLVWNHEIIKCLDWEIRKLWNASCQVKNLLTNLKIYHTFSSHPNCWDVKVFDILKSWNHEIVK